MGAGVVARMMVVDVDNPVMDVLVTSVFKISQTPIEVELAVGYNNLNSRGSPCTSFLVSDHILFTF